MFGVIEAGLVVLGAFDVFDETLMDFVEPGSEIRCSRSSVLRIGEDFGKKTRVKAVISEKRGHLRGFLKRVIVSKLGEGKQVEPVVLFVIAENAEVGLKRLIHAFGLTVCLRMKGGGLTRINLEDGGKRRPEMGGEYGTAVGDDRVREAVETNDVRNEKLSEFGGVRGL